LPLALAGSTKITQQTPMDLPASVAALGEQLRGAGEIVPDPALFCEAEVFAAEREQIFARSVLAVDHATRLAEDGRYFRCDGAPRSMILTRESGGRLYALRNICLHSGYPICDAEEGSGERLVCPYHGWEYTLAGRLVEPELSSRIDPARLQVMSYPVWVHNGLIFVDPYGKADPIGGCAGAVPAWLEGASIVRRARHGTSWNWKFLRHFLRSSPDLFFEETPDLDLEFGPLSFMIAQGRRAVLLRVIPRTVEQTDFQVIEMTAEGGIQDPGRASESDPVTDALRHADTSLSWFDRRFADWYWSLMSAAQ
jgi:nitrite reductase/ring-hydroxylating ferredoxin subunit